MPLEKKKEKATCRGKKEIGSGRSRDGKDVLMTLEKEGIAALS